ncbi:MULTISPECIES: transcriptional regulator [Streptomyces]|uniref:Transcriptional regulator n=1 Tax=Streptomyces lycii TaxID=2654337 RepID=A0ABQ7F8J4_9ACTN|nr:MULTISPECIES: transcriptional regulator [Streptomyces]KAF4405041.1 transcriptional regulator [Streptomyces lycii]PGH47697.1 transcriptional regulator [Streptomyces sp. Ru87]
MARSAREVLEEAVRELAPDAEGNRLLPLVSAGKAPREVIASFALEQRHVITADRRSFLHLADRAAADPPVEAFFTGLAQGESLALDRLTALETACGLDRDAVRDYEPRPGCQAFPAYGAWLALNAEPVDVVVALTANFAAWGNYCAEMGRALRQHYGFDDTACGFFDFFATPAPEVTNQALDAVRFGIDAGRPVGGRTVNRYGRLVQSYELMFWNTLADGLTD